MNKVLGKGLEALIKKHDTEETSRSLSGEISIEKIQPNSNQPRQIFDEKNMEELQQSIKEKGVLQPITVKQLKNGLFEIVAGERRYRAAKAIGLKWIPAYTVNVSNDSEMMELALIENIQRVNLNPIEEAEGYAILQGKHKFTHKEIAQKVSKSRTEIANKMRLLKLPPIIKDSLRKNEISYGHARALISIKESKKIIAIFYNIIKNKISVRETERLIQTLQNKNKKNLQKSKNEFEKHEKQLQNHLSTKVTIQIKQKKGLITIEFDSIKKLNKIIKEILDV